MRPEVEDLSQGAKSHLESAAVSNDQSFEALEEPPVGIQSDSRSRPAEITFDLLPGNVVARFRKRNVKGGDVLCLLKRLEHFVVLIRTD